MGLKDKLNDLKNKTTDALITAKVTYEKECTLLECFSLKDVRISSAIKGKVDLKTKTIEFSGVLDEVCKDVPKPYFFITIDGKILEVDSGSVKQETIEIKLKTKNEKHIITKAKIIEKTLSLTKK